MSVMSYTEARQNLAAVMDEVCDSRAPLIITRRRARPVVMLSLEEWEGIQETMHLLSNPKNAQRLRESIAAADRGELEPHDLIE